MTDAYVDLPVGVGTFPARVPLSIVGSQDMVHGMGAIIAEDNSKRKAIYWRDRRVCFLDGELNKRGTGKGGVSSNARKA